MPAPRHKSQCVALRLGVLDVELVNRTLQCELLPGELYLSRQAHWHIAKDHPDDYDACMSALHRVGQSPGLIGQAPNHSDNFELVIRFRSKSPEQEYVLIAVGLEVDEDGLYRIKTAYRLPERTITARRSAGRLHLPKGA